MDMLSVTTSRYSDPSGYELTQVLRPTISEPTDVLIRVRAASINPIDVKKAAGALKIALQEKFPYKIGFDCAGIVEEVGSSVSKFKIGDEVYVRLPERYRGSWSEYALCAEQYIARKPASLSFEDAASLPLAAMTAYQAFKKYDSKGSLEGKTVFVPAGLSGTGAYACQLAKNVFKAGKVITTVSTSKVPQVPELLGEGVVDQIIDYTKEDPAELIPRGSVDFLLDTTGQSMPFLSLMKPNSSMIISISTTPSGTQLEAADFMNRPDNPTLPIWVRWFLNTSDSVRRWRAWRWGVGYSYMFLGASAEDLEAISGFVEAKKLVPVIGTRTDLKDFEGVRRACQQVYDGKGGLGKAVITVA